MARAPTSTRRSTTNRDRELTYAVNARAGDDTDTTNPVLPGEYGGQDAGRFAEALAQLGDAVARVTFDEDGGVTFTTGDEDAEDAATDRITNLGKPAIHTRDNADQDQATFDQNLAKDPDIDLHTLGYELSEEVESDIQSRKEWLENYADGLGLLGLKIEKESHSSESGTVSRLGHPMLLQAVVEGQAAMSGEMLPARGPCKIEEVDGQGTEQRWDESRDLARHTNHFLTRVASEYYPDTDRGIFSLNFAGNMFKRVYHHPLRRRPAADCVSVEDLIVNESAVDLDTAVRITQRSELSRSQVRRMMWRGGWLDVELGEPTWQVRDAGQRKRDEISGTSPYLLRPDSAPYTFYQTTKDLCLEDYGYTEPNAPADVPITYRITWEHDRKRVVDIRRRWRRGDEMFERRPEYVQYGLIPALGFLNLGFLHLLGNQTRALRAAWNILFDAGMYSNIQAWIKAKGVRGSNQIRPKPGEVVEMDIGPFDDIAKAMMALPTKEPSSVFIQLSELIAKESGQVSSAVKLPVGEGRADVPVGTMMALVEQATKIATSVQTRQYRSLTRELGMFKELFAEHPEALNKLNPNPQTQWQTYQEVMDQELVPNADPNMPSQLHRTMLATAMVTVAGQNPDIYDRPKVHIRAWKQVGVDDAQEWIHEPTPQPAPGGGAAPPDPQIGQARLIEAQAKVQKTKQDAVTDQRKAANEALQASQQTQEMQSDAANKAADRQMQMQIEQMRLNVERERVQVEQERAAREHERATTELQMQHQQHQEGLAAEQMQHEQTLGQQQQQHEQGLAADQQNQAATLAHQQQEGAAQREMQSQEGAASRQHEQRMGAADRNAQATQSRGELAVKKMAAAKRPAAPRKKP